MLLQRQITYLASFLTITVMLMPFYSLAEDVATDPTITELQDKVKQLRDNIKIKQTDSNALQDKINVYQENLKSTQQKALTLESELESINIQTELTQTQIQHTSIEIEKIGLEQENMKVNIDVTEQDIHDKQQQLQTTLRQLYEYDQQTFLEIVLSHSTLSEFSAQIEYTKRLNDDLKNALENLRDLKQTLQDKQTELNIKETEQENQRVELITQQQTLQGQADYKNNLLEEVESDESKFQALVESIKKEQASIDTQITSLEKNARKALNQLATNTPSDPTNTNAAAFD